MPDDRWALIEALFQAALDRPSAERTRLLDDRCAGDPDLRARLDALLAAHDALTAGGRTGPGFLESLDAGRAEAILVSGSAAERTIGRYEVVGELGRGGMGVVYLARDPELERPVALKLLSPALAADPAAADQLLREARAASALDHPNIATVYEVGETHDGRPFLAMGYYEGETLRERIARGPLPVDEAVALAAQAADGLAAAHDGGIVHRDIKPENLVVTPRGALRILDFGVARAMEAGTTRTGATRGTVAYMSPEQTRGEPVDHRADIWALGVLLYEMLTGARPFRGDGPDAVIHGIRHDPPPPLRRVRPDAPPELARLVAACMAKDPARRLPSASALAVALREPAGATARPRWWRPALAAAGMAAALALGAAGYLAVRGPGEVGAAASGAGSTAGERDIVVLADFASDAADPRLARAVTEALRIDLHQSLALRLVEPEDAAAGLRRMGLDPAGGLTAVAARELAQRDGHKAVIAGELRGVGGGFVLAARIIAGADGATIVALRETARDSTELIATVDRLSKRLRQTLGESLRTLRAAEPLPKAATASLPALRRYAEGRALAAAGGDQTRVAALLEEAVALDPSFAVAHRALAVTYWNLRADRARTAAATRAAYELRDRLPVRDRLHVEATYYWHLLGDPRRTAEAYRRVLALDPGDLAARNNLALAMLFDGRPEEAESILREGMGRDSPPLLHGNLAEALYFQYRTEDGLAILDSAATSAGDVPLLAMARIRMLGGDGRWDEAEATARGVLDHHGARPEARAGALRALWHLALVRGRLDEADRHSRELEAILEEAAALDALARAVIQRADTRRALLGDHDRARAELNHLLDRPDIDVLTVGATIAPRLAAALAAAGDTARAARLVDAWEALPAEARGDPDTFSPELARARIDLARGRPDDAVHRLRRAADGNIHALNYLPDLALALERAGRPDSAIVVLETYLDYRHTRRLHRVPGSLGPALSRLGELYEAAGRTDDALHAYGALLDLWRDADPPLRPAVERAARRVGALAPDRGA
jgi:tetratricopeptide (TPR) repeat protein/predicted Ser/Thr protein kinase